MQTSDDRCSLLQWSSLAPRSMSATRECVYMPPGHTLHVGRSIPRQPAGAFRGRPHRDGRDRRVGGHRSPAASDRAMATRLAVAPVRPLGPPYGHGARHFPPTGRPGVVRCLGPSVRAHLPRDLRLYGGPWWTAVRGAGLARLRLALAAAWPLDRGLILGSLWALWHLPGFSVPQMLPPSGTVMDFVTFSLALIALAYIIQWVFNYTGAACLWLS